MEANNQSQDTQDNLETMDFDVVIVGGGPSGLATAIRLAQCAAEKQQTLNICVIDKGAEIGSHILSGAVLEPRSLNELIPNWQLQSSPTATPVTEDHFVYLTKQKAWHLPTPPQMRNHGNFIISLGQFCRWLASIAENMGINIFPSFAATDIIYKDNQVCGIITGSKGLDRFGKPKPQYQAGMRLTAKQTIFAEGCRGSLSEKLIAHYQLRKASDPQTYGLGFKEIWEIPENLHTSGKVWHSIGWPLDHRTYGGSFCYHFERNLLAIGFVVGLDYQNPYLNPYEEFQRFKLHPAISPLLKEAKRIAYGARTLVEGGLQSLPKLTFPGGVMVGDAAGFLNVPKIKGINNAIKSGMLAAESIFATLNSHDATQECTDYTQKVKNSWLWDDLYRVRNIRPALRYGLFTGLTLSAIDTYIFRGKAPWTFHHQVPDRKMLKKADECRKIEYPKHDNHITFDLPTSVYLANVAYVEDQPYHLKFKDKRNVPININLKEYAGPETRYCPAGVYEYIYNENQEVRLMVNGGNCIHCKACDIKDPTKNITWTPSEGGSGPQYQMM